jgi:hypothetical protein
MRGRSSTARSLTATCSSPTTRLTSALLELKEVHPGLVCINVASGLMSLGVQKRLFAFALDRLGDREPINELWMSRSTKIMSST